MLAVLVAVGLMASPAAVSAQASPPELSVDDPTLDLTGGEDEMVFTVTLVQQADPPPASPTTSPRAELPRTGISPLSASLLAAGLIVVGTGAVMMARRRPESLPIVVLVVVVAAALAGSAVPSSAQSSQPGQPGASVTVSFHTEDGDAKAGQDYTATSGALAFVPGQTTASVAVPVDANGAGSFRLVLTDPIGATLAKATGQATILASSTTTTSTTTTSTTTSTTTTSTTTTTTTTTLPPVEGCVNRGAISYRVPDGTSLKSIEAEFLGGSRTVTVEYAVIEGWYGPGCRGDDRPMVTVFGLGDAFLTDFLDRLYPGNCRCGVVGYDHTIDGLGTGTLRLLDR